MINTLLKPIDDTTLVGQDCEATKSYELLESYMSKYGGLYHDSIEWDEVERLSGTVLKHQCKHFKVLMHYASSRLVNNSADGLADSLEALAGFIEHFIDIGYPKPGEGGLIRRKRIVEQTLYRVDQLAQKMFVTLADRETHVSLDICDRLDKSLAALIEQLDATTINYDLKSLEGEIAQLRQANTKAEKSKQAEATDSNQPSTTSSIPTGDERQFKKILFDIALHIEPQQPQSPLSYLLRRYALWHGIQSVPPNAERNPEETQISAPHPNIVGEYEEQLQAKQYSQDLLQRIEKSIANSPFWLTGSVYAAQVALGLGHRLVAETIVAALNDFLRRLPNLAQCAFKGGVLFLDPEAWQTLQSQLNTARDDGRTPGAVIPAGQNIEWQALQAEIKTVLDESGVEAALNTIEQYRLNATSQRESHYLKLFACESLQQAGLAGLSADMLEAATDNAKTLHVREWEPEYFKKTVALLKSIKTTQAKGQ